MLTTEEKIKARNGNLVKFFLGKGYDVEKIGSRYKIHGFGGLYIKNECCYYCFSTQKGGNSIDCLMDILGYNFQEAVYALNDSESMVTTDIALNKKRKYSEKENKIFQMPSLSLNQHQAYEYLRVKRGISDSLLKIFKAQIKQDLNGNVVFLYRDIKSQKNIIGAELIGSTSKRFKGVAPGSKGAFWVAIGLPIRLFIFESCIDLLSFIDIYGKSYVNNSIMVSMSGLKYSVIFEYITNYNITEINNCIDNPDFNNKEFKAEDIFSNQLEELCTKRNIVLNRYIAIHKDWNDDIMNKDDAKKELRISLKKDLYHKFDEECKKRGYKKQDIYRKIIRDFISEKSKK